MSEGETIAPTRNGWDGFALSELQSWRCEVLTSAQGGAILFREPKAVVSHAGIRGGQPENRLSYPTQVPEHVWRHV